MNKIALLIKVSNGFVVDGNHRYVAGRIVRNTSPKKDKLDYSYYAKNISSYGSSEGQNIKIDTEPQRNQGLCCFKEMRFISLIYFFNVTQSPYHKRIFEETRSSNLTFK